jgi:S1-C subfamily serine protease
VRSAKLACLADRELGVTGRIGPVAGWPTVAATELPDALASPNGPLAGPVAQRARATEPPLLRAVETARDTVVKVGNGSGVIVGRNGNDYYILTNAHVVGAFNDREQVVTPDGQRLEGVVVKNNQWFDFTGKGDDLAVVRVRSMAEYKVAPVATGEVRTGAPVLQAGFPQRGDNAFLLSRRGTGLYATLATVTHDLDPNDQNPSHRVIGSYEVGLSRGLAVGSSGGGTFNAGGALVGINGRFSAGLPMPTQDGRTARPAAATKAYVIDSQTIRGFLQGLVPGY